MSKRAKKRSRKAPINGNLKPVKILDPSGSPIDNNPEKATRTSEKVYQGLYPNLRNNYASGETKERITKRQELLQAAAEHLILYLEDNPQKSISYLDFYHTFKLEERHICGLQSLLIKTAPEDRRWLIVQYDQYNLPILSIIRSIHKPDNYSGPNLPMNYDKAMSWFNGVGLNGNSDTINGVNLNARTVQPLTVLEVPDNRPVRLPPKPRKEETVEEKLITYIEHKCPNQTISLFDVAQVIKGWNYSVPMLNKRVRKYGIKLVESGDFMLTINKIPV